MPPAELPSDALPEPRCEATTQSGSRCRNRPIEGQHYCRVHAALAELDPRAEHDVVVNLQGDFPTLDPEGLRLVVTPLADPSVDIGTLVVPIRD